MTRGTGAPYTGLGITITAAGTEAGGQVSVGMDQATYTEATEETSITDTGVLQACAIRYHLQDRGADTATAYGQKQGYVLLSTEEG